MSGVPLTRPELALADPGGDGHESIADRLPGVVPKVYAPWSVTGGHQWVMAQPDMAKWVVAPELRVRRPVVEPVVSGFGGGRLLFAETFIRYVQLHRVCWITGRLGGGKTLLSVAIAEELLRLGEVQGVITNFPAIMPQALGREDGSLYGRAVIFDEAWTVLDSRDSLVNPREYGAYARKMFAYWLFPSIHMIDKRLRSVICWRSATLFDNFWVYRWLVDVEHKYAGGNPEGWFVLWRPQYYFGHYDTDYIPMGDEGISSRYWATIYDLTKGRGVVEPQRVKDYLGSLQLDVLEQSGVLLGET